MVSLQELKYKRNKLLTDMQAIGQKGFTTESRTAFDAMAKDVEAVESDIQRAELLEARAIEQASFTRSARPGTSNGGVETNLSKDEKNERTRKAFLQYARTGFGGMNSEQRDLLTTSDATGGALIPQMFNPELIAALKFYGPIATLVRQRVTDNNGAPLKVSLANDTGNSFTLLGTQGTSTPPETDPAFVSKIVGVDTVSAGLVKVSVQELEDSSFDLDSWIRYAFGLRYARGMEKSVTLGVDGAGTTLPNQTAGGMNAGAVVGQTTASLAAGFGWDDLTAAYGALDPAYTGPKAVWQLNSATRAYLVGVKDNYGRPLFTPDPAQDGPFDKLLGFKVVLNQSLPNMGASAKPILFGDPSAAYLLRTDGQPTIVRLNERYMDTLEIGFFLYTRLGGTSIVMSGAPNPLVSIQQAAS